jgi:hypothetical protein
VIILAPALLAVLLSLFFIEGKTKKVKMMALNKTDKLALHVAYELSECQCRHCLEIYKKAKNRSFETVHDLFQEQERQKILLPQDAKPSEGSSRKSGSSE